MLSVVGKIYTGILLGKVCRVTEGLIEIEEGGLRSGKSWGEKTKEIVVE